MIKSYLRTKISKQLRKLRRKVKANRLSVSIGIGAFALLVVGVNYISMDKQINIAVYKPLLHVIANAESNGNYNAYFGSASNTGVVFTEMTIAEVMDWQKKFIESGSPSSAVGRYQIMDFTLKSLVSELELDTNQLFDEQTQDTMAAHLLEKRGASSYLTDQISAEEFASNLSQEWAALPNVLGSNPESGYYDGDGLNKSRVSRDQILAAIDTIDK